MKPTTSAAINRRACLAGGGASIAALLSSPLLAQARNTHDLLPAMSRLTGAKLEGRWIEPTANLLDVILEDSRSLRSLDLGEVEPATTFIAG